MDENFLCASKVRIKRRDGRLMLKMDGQCLELSQPRRATPLSAPDEFIVLSGSDGKEIGIVRRLEDLEPDSRALLGDELSYIYRSILITRVMSIKRDPVSGLIRWKVEIESDSADDEPQLAPGLKPGLGVRLLKAARAKAPAEANAKANANLPGELLTGREMTFEIAGNEDVQNARYPRIFIGDTEGHRYEIPNCEKLDLVSRRLGERYF